MRYKNMILGQFKMGEHQAKYRALFGRNIARNANAVPYDNFLCRQIMLSFFQVHNMRCVMIWENKKKFIVYFTLLTMNLILKPNVEIALFFSRLQNNDDILFSLIQLNTNHQWGKHSMWEFQRKVVLNQIESFICDCSFKFIFLNYIKLISPYQDLTSLSTIWNTNID